MLYVICESGRTVTVHSAEKRNSTTTATTDRTEGCSVRMLASAIQSTKEWFSWRGVSVGWKSSGDYYC